jgi:hypothetical protein
LILKLKGGQNTKGLLSGFKKSTTDQQPGSFQGPAVLSQKLFDKQ